MEGGRGRDSRYTPDKHLLKMCGKHRLIELMRYSYRSTAASRRCCKWHFGIKAAQQLVHEPKGGTIWRTRGSGKSIVMVLLARWLLQDNRMRGWW